jgi:hypothetical protein
MEANEIEFFYINGSSQIKDIYTNSKLRGTRLMGLRPKIAIVQESLLREAGLDLYIEVCKSLSYVMVPSQAIYFIAKGPEVMSDPLSLGQLMDIMLNHNNYE